MFLVKPIRVGVTEQTSQGGIKEPLLEGNVCAGLSIGARSPGLRSQKVAVPEMCRDLVQGVPKDGMVFPERSEEIR